MRRDRSISSRTDEGFVFFKADVSALIIAVDFRNAVVNYIDHVALVLSTHKDVLRLEISMDHTSIVDVLKDSDKLVH